MHEWIFANERYFGGPHDLLFKKLRALHRIPKEVIGYRIKCLKGKAPANVPAIVYEYPPPHRGSSGLTDTWATPDWTYPWILPGDTAETTRHQYRKIDPADYRKETAAEIRESVAHGLKHIESYENNGRKSHPEYAFITDKRKRRVEDLKVILREKVQEEKEKAKRRNTAKKAA
jgi:hypothetical protein